MKNEELLYFCLTTLYEYVEAEQQQMQLDCADNCGVEYEIEESELRVLKEKTSYDIIRQLEEAVKGTNIDVVVLHNAIDDNEWNTIFSLLDKENYNNGIICFPSGIKNIPPCLFERSDFHRHESFFTTVILPENLQSIGSAAFKNCRNLECIINFTENIQIENDALQGTEYLAQRISGEKPCLANVLNSISVFDPFSEKIKEDGIADRLAICLSPVNENAPAFQSCLKDMYKTYPDHVMRILVEVGDADKLKCFMDNVATRKNIDDMMKRVIEQTEKTGNYQFRLEMMEYQHERGLYPRMSTRKDYEL